MILMSMRGVDQIRSCFEEKSVTECIIPHLRLVMGALMVRCSGASCRSRPVSWEHACTGAALVGSSWRVLRVTAELIASIAVTLLT